MEGVQKRELESTTEEPEHLQISLHWKSGHVCLTGSWTATLIPEASHSSREVTALRSDEHQPHDGGEPAAGLPGGAWGSVPSATTVLCSFIHSTNIYGPFTRGPAYSLLSGIQR